MSLKSFFYAVAATTAAFLLPACQAGDNAADDTAGEELLFYPVVKDMGQQMLTRATNTFFREGDEVTAEVVTSRASADNSSSHIYTYNAAGIFTGRDNPVRFKLDNTYVAQLVVLWPTEAVRAEGAITDQRDFEEYRKAHWLSAEARTANIMPTNEPVPLLFEHEHSRLTFRLAGQNAYGIDIKDLILELDAVLHKGQGLEEAAFRAYCKEDGTAELILPAGTRIAPGGGADSRSLIGLVTIESRDPAVKDYRGAFYIPGNTDLTLQKSTDYLVTLTPEGYDLYARIVVEGFSQNDGYAGIPIRMPEKTDEGQYRIDTPLQLVTLSLLLQGYIKSEEAAAGRWDTYAYTLARGLAMTGSTGLWYKPIAASLKGIFGAGVLSVKGPDGITDFALFVED